MTGVRQPDPTHDEQLIDTKKRAEEYSQIFA